MNIRQLVKKYLLGTYHKAKRRKNFQKQLDTKLRFIKAYQKFPYKFRIQSIKYNQLVTEADKLARKLINNQ